MARGDTSQCMEGLNMSGARDPVVVLRHWAATVLVCVVVLGGVALSTEALAPKGEGRAIRAEALFSPGGGCESRLVEEIGAARKNIRVQMYIFTSKRIGEALAKAAKRGVRVEVILDKSQEKATYGPWRVMRRDGVKVFFDAEHDTANNKIVLIDKRTIITGSYNFTKAAEDKNAENILLIRNARDLFETYLENFNAHLAHARPAEG